MVFKKFNSSSNLSAQKFSIYQKMVELSPQLKDKDDLYSLGRLKETSSLVYHISGSTVVINPVREGLINSPEVYIYGEETTISKAISRLEKIIKSILYEVKQK